MSIVLDLQSQSNWIITTTFSLDLPLIKVKQMQVMKLTKFKKVPAFSDIKKYLNQKESTKNQSILQTGQQRGHYVGISHCSIS